MSRAASPTVIVGSSSKRNSGRSLMRDGEAIAMPGSTPPPADLARELIRLIDDKEAAADAVENFPDNGDRNEWRMWQKQYHLASFRLGMFSHARTIAEALLAALDDITDKDASFDLRHNADMRAIKAWQEKTGEELVWPDHADLCVWLMGRLAAAEADNADLRGKLLTAAERIAAQSELLSKRAEKP